MHICEDTSRLFISRTSHDILTIKEMMELKKYVSCAKLSKKKKREQDLKKRSTWGEINPVTRKTTNAKLYNRKKARRWMDDHPNSGSFFVSRESNLIRHIQIRVFDGRQPAKDAVTGDDGHYQEPGRHAAGLGLGPFSARTLLRRADPRTAESPGCRFSLSPLQPLVPA